MTPGAWRAWGYLVYLSWRRQARARWMTWISLALLGLTLLLVYFNTRLDRWTMANWRFPNRSGPTYAHYLDKWYELGVGPMSAQERSLHLLGYGAAQAVVVDGSRFFVFSNVVVFFLFGTFLLPLWTLSFATEGLGAEREARNLIWVLTRPLSRPAIYLAKFCALLPWCLLFNLGGLALLCVVAGAPGLYAFRIYWPAVVLGTLAFAAFFHALAALFHRPALLALLYSFFFESIAGNLPGQLKRLSISYYTRCLMFERAHAFGIQPERPSFYVPVDGDTAFLILAIATLTFLVAGMLIFSRKEYLDVV